MASTVPMSAGASDNIDDILFASTTPSPANALPPAYGSFGTLLTSALHPQLLILYSYFALIGYLLHRVLLKSVFSEAVRSQGWKARRLEVVAWSVMAIVSLGSTWTYMVRYFGYSYASWLRSASLTSLGVPALPECPSSSPLFSSCPISLIATKLQRASLWLTYTSLFSEAWLHVVSDDANWWWSVEVCLFTVGAWVVFLHSQGRRIAIPFTWAYMLLGQTVAISVAASLFHLALALRPLPDGTLLQSASLRAVHAFETGEERQDIVSVKEEEEEVQPNMKSEDDDSALVKRTRVTTVRHSFQSPSIHPSLGVRLLLWVFVGLASLHVAKRPESSIGSIFFLHALPLLSTLPTTWLTDLGHFVEAHLLHPTPGSEDEAAMHAANERVRRLLRPSRLLAGLAVYGLYIKLSTILRLVVTINSTMSPYDRRTIGLLPVLLRTIYPTTFFSHPAQSSISSDAVCLWAISLQAIVLDLLNPAPALTAAPEAASPLNKLGKETTRLAFALAALSPLLGPSVTYAAWQSWKEHLLETAEERDEVRIRREAKEEAAITSLGTQKNDGSKKQGNGRQRLAHDDEEVGLYVLIEHEEVEVVRSSAVRRRAGT